MNRLLSIGTNFLVPSELGPSRVPGDLFSFLSSACMDLEQEKNDAVEAPIFLMSAGWRSGSTLLQRMICSDRTVLMWGEPFGDLIPIARLAASVAEMGPQSAHLNYPFKEGAGTLANEWIANLNPGVSALRAAHLAYFDRLFGVPAKWHGYSCWGVKCVRLTAFHAAYLKWLYPHAKFIFLVRHPLMAYQSYKGRRWYLVRPNYRVDNALRFVVHWRFLAASFHYEHHQLGAMLVRYEDLLSNSKTLDALEEFLSIRIQRDLLERKVGSSEVSKNPLRVWERLACQWLTKDIRELLGYTKSGVEPGYKNI